MSRSEALYPEFFNVTLTDADTEYSLVIPNATKSFTLHCRTSFAVRFAFVTGKVAGPTEPYGTVKPLQAWVSPEKGSWSGTMYFASAQAAVVVEVLCWKSEV
jgi:hypothetical protein